MTSLQPTFKSNNKSNNKSNICMDIINLSCLFISLCAVITILLGFPVIEIYYGIFYFNKIDCISSINIPIDVWLIVKGLSSMLNIISSCVIIKNEIRSKIIFSHILIVNNIFTFIWLILGSIIYWRDCSYCKPESVNILMNFSLILGFMKNLTMISQNNNLLTYNNSRPLLEV
jgi:hypothetical protein